MQAKKKERKKGFEEEEKNSHKDLGKCHTRDILIKVFNTCVASPKFYLKQSSHAKTITCRKMRREIKTKRRKKTTLNNVIINMRYV